MGSWRTRIICTYITFCWTRKLFYTTSILYLDTNCNSKEWRKKTILLVQMLVYMKMKLTFVAGTYSITHVRNAEIKQLSPLVFTMLWDIDLLVGMWVYNDKLQIKFTFRSGPIIFASYGPWTLKFGQIFSCHHFISLWFAILTWFLVWECIIISYRSNLKFLPVEWFLANLQPLGFWNLSKYLVVTTLFHYDLRYWLDFWYESV